MVRPDSNLASQLVLSALKDGLLFLGGGPDGNVLSFTPPFCIETEEIDYTCDKIYCLFALGIGFVVQNQRFLSIRLDRLFDEFDVDGILAEHGHPLLRVKLYR